MRNAASGRRWAWLAPGLGTADKVAEPSRGARGAASGEEAARAGRRRQILSLTQVGAEAFSEIDAASRNQVAGLLEPLSGTNRDGLVRAMRTVEDILGGEAERPAPFDGFGEGLVGQTWELAL